MYTSVIIPCMLHVDVITPDYITLSQPKSQPHYPVLHSKVKNVPVKHQLERQLNAQ